MASPDKQLQRAMLAFRERLAALEKPLCMASAEKRGDIGSWGVAGLSENYLTWLLGCAMAHEGFEGVRPERRYRGAKTRCDLKATKPKIWIEAKWWWRSSPQLEGILENLEPKLSNVAPDYERYGLVYTVNEAGCALESGGTWTVDGAKDRINDRMTKWKSPRWKHVTTVAIQSRYFGFSSQENPRKPMACDGIFAASLFHLTG